MFHISFNYGLVLHCLQYKFRVIEELLIALPSVVVCLEECVLAGKIIFNVTIFRISELMKSNAYCSFN